MKTVFFIATLLVLTMVSCQRVNELERREWKSKITFPEIEENKSYKINTRYYEEIVFENQEEGKNSYYLQAIYFPNNPMTMWIFKYPEDRARALNYGIDIEVFPNLKRKKELPFLFYTTQEGTHKMKFVVTDKYGNTFESKIYELTFQK
ncbi:hypothetical protein [Porphyromonas gingivicanis]|uniref:hypothetical protein n=1 Tax=Porphyromonas gingivicanis TaxID=266762 RepID=UPI0004726CCA|nr:hypothetical protein [Porphyromonas gingivicanis]